MSKQKKGIEELILFNPHANPQENIREKISDAVERYYNNKIKTLDVAVEFYYNLRASKITFREINPQYENDAKLADVYLDMLCILEPACKFSFMDKHMAKSEEYTTMLIPFRMITFIELAHLMDLYLYAHDKKRGSVGLFKVLANVSAAGPLLNELSNSARHAALFLEQGRRNNAKYFSLSSRAGDFRAELNKELSSIYIPQVYSGRQYVVILEQYCKFLSKNMAATKEMGLLECNSVLDSTQKSKNITLHYCHSPQKSISASRVMHRQSITELIQKICANS